MTFPPVAAHFTYLLLDPDTGVKTEEAFAVVFDKSATLADFLADATFIAHRSYHFMFKVAVKVSPLTFCARSSGFGSQWF